MGSECLSNKGDEEYTAASADRLSAMERDNPEFEWWARLQKEPHLVFCKHSALKNQQSCEFPFGFIVIPSE